MVLNKRTIESLIKAGAFDSLGHPRQGLCLVFEDIVDRTLERRREEQAGDLHPVLLARGVRDDGDTGPAGPAGFADARVPIPDTEFDKTQRLAFEKEMLGLYVSDHPLRGVEGALARLIECSIADLKDGRTPSSSTASGGATVRSAPSGGSSPTSSAATRSGAS